MGYTTEFFGEFELDKELTPAQIDYLKAFNDTRRMIRDPVIAEGYSDPKREAVGLPIGNQGAYFVGNEEDMGQIKDSSVLDYNMPPKEQPGLWCHWKPGGQEEAEESHIGWDGGEKFYEYTGWLQYIALHFLEPWGIGLTGEVTWRGEESDDRGIIYAKGFMVEEVSDSIENGGPSWDYLEVATP